MSLSEANSNIKLINDETFLKEVIEQSKTQAVMVDFYTPWCKPCQTLELILKKLVQETKNSIKLVKINIDENPIFAGRMGVISVPAVFVFKNEQAIHGFAGIIPEIQIKNMIKEVL